MPNWITLEGQLADGLPMRLYIAERENKLCAACLHDDVHPRSAEEFEWQINKVSAPHSPSKRGELLEAARRQVSEYFAGRRLRFDLPLHWEGTDFQICVWQQLQTIPFGETRSYQEIAEQIGIPKGARPVGSANGKNRLPLLVPCHRVIAAGGKLGGFTGGLGLKRRLLAHEAAVLGRTLAAL